MAQAKTSSSDTRLQLLEAAETLFAHHGIQNVSLRQVNTAAGQRNSGSVHYHFGSRDAMLEEILHTRMRVLNEACLALLEEEDEKQADAHTLLCALSSPFLDRIGTSEGWRNYALIARELLEFRNRDLQHLWQGKYDSGAREIFESLRKLAPDCGAVRWQIAVEETTKVGLGLIADRAQKLLETAPQERMLNDGDFAQHLIWLQHQILFEGLSV